MSEAVTSHSTLHAVVLFSALVLTAVAVIPGGAHLFELHAKIGLDADQYFLVQQLYAGWAFFGIASIGTVLLDLALVVLMRGSPAIGYAAFALAAALLSLAIFFIWTFPANQATANWTAVPDNWEQLRTQWEYSHAANAVVTFLGFCSLVLAALQPR